MSKKFLNNLMEPLMKNENYHPNVRAFIYCGGNKFQIEKKGERKRMQEQKVSKH